MTVRIINADVMEGLRQLPDGSVHCVVTSPPYWRLRDYGVEGQIGLEPTLGEFIARLVDVFREVRRVLRDDGTCWVNMGDGYASAGGAGWQGKNGQRADRRFTAPNLKPKAADIGLKPKDLIGQPWRLAFALQDDGWWLRNDIIWHKPNPMPETVADRCTKTHEYVFLLTKSERYHFDAEAIAEPASPNTNARSAKIKKPDGWDTGAGGHGSFHRNGREKGQYVDRPGVGPKSADESSLVKGKGSFHASTVGHVETRNKRSVWTIATTPFPEAHFATFPPELPEICIKAGCPKGGTVLDPFGGAGTTGLVADRLQRNAILIELNSRYAAMAKRRLARDRLERGDGTMDDVKEAQLPPTPLEALMAEG